MFANLIATINDDHFQHALAEVLCGDPAALVAGEAPRGDAVDSAHTASRLSLEDQERLRARIDETINAHSTVTDFTHKYDIDKVRSSSNSFFAVASLLPKWDPDELGFHIRLLYCEENPAWGYSSLPQHTRDQVAMLNADLRSVGLLELKNEAAEFYMAIGGLS